MTGSAAALRLAVRLGLSVAACGLAIAVVQAAVVRTADPGWAVEVSPRSAIALNRAADAASGRQDLADAGSLARRSLRLQPFDAAALRNVGLAEAERASRAGVSLDRADDLLTLAGNWDLRDDPSHIWLLSHRLGQQDYSSAFGHADTLLRRRTDAQEVMFKLLNVSALGNPSAAAALVDLLRRQPNWRSSYWAGLSRSAAGEDQALAATLSLGLSAGEGKLTEAELFQLYAGLVTRDRLPLLIFLRQAHGVPPLTPAVVDGSFEGKTPAPFGWTLATGPNTQVQILGDDARDHESALRVDHRGISRVTLANQLLLLEPGPYKLRFEQRVEEGRGSLDLAWRVVCRSGGQPLVEQRLTGTDPGLWRSQETTFSIPAEGCAAQRLELVTRPRDVGTPVSVWFDHLQIQGLGPKAQL